MRFLNKKMVVVINRMATELTGGTSTSSTNIRAGQSLSFVDGIFHNSLFGQTLYPDIFHRAAAYMFFVIKNHTFNDGNKRTGLACAVTFLQWNNIQIRPFDENIVFDFVTSIAAGQNKPDKAIPEIADWFANMAVR